MSNIKPNTSNFSEGLKRARKKAGIKRQEDFANEINKSLNAVQKWEQGKTSPSLDDFIDLCDFFKCDADYLLARIDEKTHDLAFICEFTGLSEDVVSGLHTVFDSKTIHFFDFFIRYCGLHAEILSNINKAVLSQSKANGQAFSDQGFFVSEQLKKLLGVDAEGSVILPEGAIPLSASDAADFYIDSATRLFRECLSTFVKEANQKKEAE